MPVSDRPDFGRWVYFAFLLSLSSGCCIRHFQHGLDGEAFADARVFSLRSCTRRPLVGKCWGNRRAIMRRLACAGVCLCTNATLGMSDFSPVTSAKRTSIVPENLVSA